MVTAWLVLSSSYKSYRAVLCEHRKHTTSIIYSDRHAVRMVDKDLAHAMRTALEKSGDLIALRAQMEEEILEAYQGDELVSDFGFPNKRTKPAMPPEIILVNTLIRQYLEGVGLKKTSAVLCIETGLSQSAVPDSVLKTTFSSIPSSETKPLLCSMIHEIMVKNSK